MRTRNSTSFAAVVCALAALLNFSAPPAARAQDTNRPDPKFAGEPPGTYVIRNARVVTVSGADIDNGTIVISNGRIASVGAAAQVPAGAQEIDASGLWVYPGMIDAATNMGLTEIAGGAPGTLDTQELGELNPNIAAWWGINPHSSHVNVTRVAGVTSVVTMPSGGIVSGQAAVINLAGSSQREMTVVPTAALVIDFPRLGGSGNFANLLLQQQGITPEAVSARERRIDELRRILRDAEAYGRAQDAHARDPKNIPRPTTDLKLAALVPYVRGERPVLLRADRARDIRGAVAFAQEMRLRPVILGGSDAGHLAQFLKERNVPVILDSVLNLPLREDDPYDTLYETASRLQAAGVPFCISAGDSGPHVRDLPFQAGMAAAFGLPRAEALKAVTLYPAQIMGVADRMGSIEAGKIANLVVTDGDLLEARTNVRHLFIAGRQIPLVSRHTMLYEQFKDRK